MPQRNRWERRRKRSSLRALCSIHFSTPLLDGSRCPVSLRSKSHRTAPNSPRRHPQLTLIDARSVAPCSVDPWHSRTAHHPLLFYASMASMTALVAPPLLRFGLGLRRRRAGRLTYWFHPGDTGADGAARPAIVFWHGIGVGLAPYEPPLPSPLPSLAPAACAARPTRVVSSAQSRSSTARATAPTLSVEDGRGGEVVGTHPPALRQLYTWGTPRLTL